MAFQFQCPQGHVLETDESYAGQSCQCPYCGVTFAIPTPPHPPGPQPGAPTFSPFPHQPSAPPAGFPGGGYPGAPALGSAPPAGTPGPFPSFPSGPLPQPGPAPAPFTPQTPAEPEILHIACPNGHELETPRDMLNQDVLCPHCQVQFRLREKDSVEYKRRRELERQRREQKAGKNWLNFAIVAAVIVVLGLAILIALSTSNK